MTPATALLALQGYVARPENSPDSTNRQGHPPTECWGYVDTQTHHVQSQRVQTPAVKQLFQAPKYQYLQQTEHHCHRDLSGTTTGGFLNALLSVIVF